MAKAYSSLLVDGYYRYALINGMQLIRDELQLAFNR